MIISITMTTSMTSAFNCYY